MSISSLLAFRRKIFFLQTTFSAWHTAVSCTVKTNLPWVWLPAFPQTFLGQSVIKSCDWKYHYSVSESEVAQSCPTLCNLMDCSLPGSTIHEIFQARILGWAAISFSRGSARPKDWTWVSHIAGRLFTVWATREAQLFSKYEYLLCVYIQAT